MGEFAIEAELQNLDPASGAEAGSLRKIAGKLVRRKWLLGSCLVLAWVGAAMYLRKTPPVLETSATVYVQALSQSLTGAAAPDGVLSVQPSIMRSAPVASVAILSSGIRDLG